MNEANKDTLPPNPAQLAADATLEPKAVMATLIAQREGLGERIVAAAGDHRAIAKIVADERAAINAARDEAAKLATQAAEQQPEPTGEQPTDATPE
jgi:hypothetical protein